MAIYTHAFTVGGQTINVSFVDKRTFNSFVKAFEKATRTEITESVFIEDPSMFEDWTIHQKDGHVAIKPPENTPREMITLKPDFVVKWCPTFTAKYWNDGMYHFFSKKLSAEFSNNDIVENLVSMGAKKV